MSKILQNPFGMPSSPQGRNPTTWDEYHGAPSPGSMSSSVLAEEQALLDEDDNGFDEEDARIISIPERRR